MIVCKAMEIASVARVAGKFARRNLNKFKYGLVHAAVLVRCQHHTFVSSRIFCHHDGTRFGVLRHVMSYRNVAIALPWLPFLTGFVAQIGPVVVDWGPKSLVVSQGLARVVVCCKVFFWFMLQIPSSFSPLPLPLLPSSLPFSRSPARFL